MVLEMEMSKTYQYRKVMKPMLERKRRARINKCLDELKDIMVECLTQEGEHITRLEKADILELTVEHMKKLRTQNQLRLNSNQDAKLTIAESFRSGYIHAANEVSKTLAAVPGISIDLGTQLMSHLGHRLNYLQVIVPSTVTPLGMALGNTNSPSSSSISSNSPTSPATLNLPATVVPGAGTGTGTGAGSGAGVTPATTISSVSMPAPPNSPISTTALTSPYHTTPADPSLITPPPSECSSSGSESESSGSVSPAPSDNGSMWRPW